MKKSKMKKSSFAGKIKDNASKRKKGATYGYLQLPKGVDMFSPEMDSKVVFDIMPYKVTDKHHPDAPNAEVGELWYKRPFKTHRSIGVNNSVVVCPTSFGKKCPICEYRAKLKKKGGEEEEIKALRPSDRNMYAIILKGKKSKSNKVMLFDFSDYLFQERFEEQLGDKPGFETFPDLEEGSSLEVRFAENNFGGNKFADPTRFDFVPRSEPYDEDILESVPNLDEMFIVLSYEELKAKFFEIEEDEDDDEDDEPRKKKSNKTSKKVEEEEDEDDEDEDEDEDDEDEDDEDEDDEDEDDEDEDDEDEDDEDEDDEDDEDEEPVRKKGKVPPKKVPAKKAPDKKVPERTKRKR
jgi:hypothetical protein